MEGEKLTMKSILDIHASMTENTLDESNQVCLFRKSDDIYVTDNMTGEVVHTPLKHIHISKVNKQGIKIIK